MTALEDGEIIAVLSRFGSLRDSRAFRAELGVEVAHHLSDAVTGREMNEFFSISCADVLCVLPLFPAEAREQSNDIRVTQIRVEF